MTLNVKITCLKGGWAGGQAKVNGNKNTGTLQLLKPPTHYLAHRLPNVCEKMFFTSFVPQPVENNTFTLLRGASLGQLRECPPT